MVVDPHVAMSERPRLADVEDGKFGRMFPDLPALESQDEALLALGRRGGPLEIGFEGEDPLEISNPRIPAGWPFFGQFLAHDMTHDRDPLGPLKDLSRARNFRSPRLDLDSVYGAGPVGQPYLYDVNDPDLLLVGRDDRSEPFDLPRNFQGQAIVSDARNDVHLFISQLHVGFLRFHNAVVGLVRDAGATGLEVMTAARRIVEWHYQWIVVNEFLRLSCGDAIVDEILRDGPRLCRFGASPFIPVEFSDGAYRFGHAQIQDRYDVNDDVLGLPLFPDLVGIQAVAAQRRVDWPRVFAFDGLPAPQPSRRIRSDMVRALLELPTKLVGVVPRPEHASLASRDLVRGRAVGLPSGEAVARALGIEPCTKDEFALSPDVWSGETPLFLYVLKEAEVQTSGQHLGELGGRIVAEVILGLLVCDPLSYLNAAEGWTPDLAGPDGRFTIAHLLAVAGVAPAPGGSADAVTPTAATPCAHLDQIQEVEPDAQGCGECLAVGGRWVHLRLCLTCGNVGCCDQSPNRHASAHHRATQHPIIRSFEPGEDWAWCYLDEVFL